VTSGFLADAVVNYLARLGWSHGDDELFTRELSCSKWFDLAATWARSAGAIRPGEVGAG
jgi:glutamyl/glutaminyl-tRNA synthetase